VNDARTMTYEVSAAAKPPQTIPLNIGIRVDTRGANGGYRRRRAVTPLPPFLSHLSHFDGLDVRFAPRRAGGDTRRFFRPVDAIAYKTGGCLRRVCRRRYFVRHCLRVIPADSLRKTAFFILLATQVIGARAGGIKRNMFVAREAESDASPCMRRRHPSALVPC